MDKFFDIFFNRLIAWIDWIEDIQPVFWSYAALGVFIFLITALPFQAVRDFYWDHLFVPCILFLPIGIFFVFCIFFYFVILPMYVLKLAWDRYKKGVPLVRVVAEFTGGFLVLAAIAWFFGFRSPPY